MAENRYGIMVDEYSLHTDGKGAGTYRGGSGCVRVYRAMNDNEYFSANFGRNTTCVWGFEGGRDGSRNYFEFFGADGVKKDGPMGVAAQYKMDKNDYVRMVCATGGAYGDPMKRDPEKVAWDAKNAYITVEQAEEDYGVVLDRASFAIIGLKR